MPQRSAWIVTVLIVLLGGAALYLVLNTTERKRLRVLDRLDVGDDTVQVAGLLGPASARCPATDLEHLRSGLPADWPPAALQEALETLEARTVERWLYPLDRREQADCALPRKGSEIGVDAEGRVLWLVAVPGETPLELPRDFTPETLGRPAPGAAEP